MDNHERTWTKKDVLLLIELETDLVPRMEIANRLGRTIRAIAQKLFVIGMARFRRRAVGNLMRAVSEVWAPGKSDTDIAGELRCKNYASVTNARNRLGLPCGLTASERGQLANRYHWAGKRKADREL